MTKEVYEEILEDVMLPWAWSNLGQDYVFQQDNDPKHSSRLVKNWFRKRRVHLIKWPSQSPELNPIEHLWEELECRLRVKNAKNIDEKIDQLQQEWANMDQRVIDNLLNTMHHRCQAVINEKCLPTKY